MDISFAAGWEGKEVIVDTAVTHALRTEWLHTPGQAAARYEEHKDATYADVVDPVTQVFFPVVWDSFGNSGPKSAKLLRRVATAFASRYGTKRNLATICLARLNGCLHRALAAPLLQQRAATFRSMSSAAPSQPAAYSGEE